MTTWFGWRACFFLLSACLLSLLCFGGCVLVETCPDNSGAPFWQDIRYVFLNKHLMVLVIAECLGMSYIMGLTANASYVTHNFYKMSMPETSLYYAGLMLALAFGFVIPGASNCGSLFRTTKISFCVQMISIPLLAYIGFYGPKSFGAFLGSTYVGAVLTGGPIMALSTLYMQPLGSSISTTASAFQDLFTMTLSGALTKITTSYTIAHGRVGLMSASAVSVVAMQAVFWLGFAVCAPTWAVTAGTRQGTAKQGEGLQKQTEVRKAATLQKLQCPDRIERPSASVQTNYREHLNEDCLKSNAPRKPRSPRLPRSPRTPRLGASPSTTKQ